MVAGPRPRCPSEDELLAYALGAADPATRGRLNAHLPRCPGCRRVAAVAMSVGSDPSGSADAPLFVGPYPCHDRLGAGALGLLYRTEHPAAPRATLRIVSPALTDGLDRSQLLSTVSALVGPAIDGVCSFLDCGIDDDELYVVRPRVAGDPLSMILAEPQTTPASSGFRMNVLVQVGRTLQRLHEAGFVHGRLTARDVWIVGDHGVVLTDYGLGALAERPLTGPQHEHHAMTDRVELCRLGLRLLEGVSVPGRVRRVLEGGRAPQGPYRTLPQLLDALERNRRRPARRLALPAAALGALAFGASSDSLATPTHPVCDGPGPLRDASTRRELVAWSRNPTPDWTGPAQLSIVAELDAYARRWRAVADDACTSGAPKARRDRACLEEAATAYERLLDGLAHRSSRERALSGLDDVYALPPTDCTEGTDVAMGPPELAELYDARSRQLVAQGKLDEADRQALQAFSIRDRLFGHVHPEIGRSHVTLARLAMARGMRHTARYHVDTARRIFTETGDSPPPELVRLRAALSTTEPPS